MTLQIFVVIPAYKASWSIMGVLARIGPEIHTIYVVDDACPQATGQHVLAHNKDPRVHVLFNQENKGVGGATKAGYVAALQGGADIIVKIDSDGQMAPEILLQIAGPVIRSEADYSKGNRFWNVEDVRAMPPVRIIGNAAVSFFSKISTGYWRLFDPANGYTAISASALRSLPLHKIADRYFFESDMLFRLALAHRRVADVPMTAVYGEETSGLKIGHTLFTFLGRYAKNTFKRIALEYAIRDFNVASMALLVALTTLPWGLLHGVWMLVSGWMSGEPSQTGSIVLTAILLIVGYVSLMNFFAFDYAKSPILSVAKDEAGQDKVR